VSLHELDACDLVAGYRKRELSPVEVTTACLERVSRYDAEVNAFRLVDDAAALSAAAESERRWLGGVPAGALDGVPVGVKDLFLTRGMATLRGSRSIRPEQDWDIDAPAVAALRRHGAVILGKTTTPEFGWKGVTDSPLDGITRNPWDTAKTAGGSSGGSAAALAAGMVPLALGTDAGGSIRIPSGFCGLPAIKPTFGRVPVWPASPFGVLSHAGPMARTARDTALLLDVLAEPDDRDWTALEPPEGSFQPRDRDLAGLSLAFSPDLGYADVDAEVAEIVARAVDRLAALGATVGRAEPAFSDPRSAFETIWAAGGAALLASLGDETAAHLLDPGLVAMADYGKSLSALEFVEALRERDRLGLAMSRFHRDWDLLVTPTLPIAAFPAGQDAPDADGWSAWISWTPFTYPFNLTQQPAGTVPCGFTAAGLPVGLQFVGPRYGERLVLRAIQSYEQAYPEPTCTAPLTRPARARPPRESPGSWMRTAATHDHSLADDPRRGVGFSRRAG
jgi:aspartyl-tRNA(Asn)/glutamyl-tRNA(Gln) amidotransferase subunit A